MILKFVFFFLFIQLAINSTTSLISRQSFNKLDPGYRWNKSIRFFFHFHLIPIWNGIPILFFFGFPFMIFFDHGYLFKAKNKHQVLCIEDESLFGRHNLKTFIHSSLHAKKKKKNKTSSVISRLSQSFT